MGLHELCSRAKETCYREQTIYISENHDRTPAAKEIHREAVNVCNLVAKNCEKRRYFGTFFLSFIYVLFLQTSTRFIMEVLQLTKPIISLTPALVY
jgi:hypothetical protein